MRDRHFREDENELPYLVSEKRDPYRGGSYNRRVDFEGVPFSEFKSCVSSLLLPGDVKSEIISSVTVRPKNCIVSIHQDGDVVRFRFILKNEYLTSEFIARYESGMHFYLPYPDIAGLESREWFKQEIRRIEKETGLKQDTKSGGYSFNFYKDTLEILDEYHVRIYFRGKSQFDDYHSYKVDFNQRKLVKYHVHPWHEIYEGIM